MRRSRNGVFLYRKYWVNGASTIRTVAICKGSENPFAKKRSNLTKREPFENPPKKLFPVSIPYRRPEVLRACLSLPEVPGYKTEVGAGEAQATLSHVRERTYV